MVKYIQNKDEGFTLVELLIVIAIIGILAGVTIAVLKPAYFYGKGRNARRKSDLEAVRGALEQYFLDNGRVYPADTNDPPADFIALEQDLADYLDAFPADPGDSSYEYQVGLVAVGGVNQPKCYELSVVLENSEGTFKTCGGSLTCQGNHSLCQ